MVLQVARKTYAQRWKQNKRENKMAFYEKPVVHTHQKRVPQRNVHFENGEGCEDVSAVVGFHVFVKWI